MTAHKLQTTTDTAASIYPLKNDAAELPELRTLAVIGAQHTGGKAAGAGIVFLPEPPREGREVELFVTTAWAIDDGWEAEWEQAWAQVISAAQSPAPAQSLAPSTVCDSPREVSLPTLRGRVELETTLSREAREEFERLHRVLLLAVEQRGLQALLVSGVGAGDGASFVTQHVSRLLAESGRLRVVSVTIERGATTGGGELFALGETDLPNLYTASFVCGTESPRFHEAAFGAFLERLREHFDFILLDAPAVTAHPEAVRFGARCDGVMLVAREGATPQRLIEAAYDLFDEARANLLGVVLNRCEARAGGAQINRTAGCCAEPRAA